MRARTSSETFEKLKAGGVVKMVSYLPLDRHDCDCFSLIQDWSDKFSRMTPEQIKDIKSKGVINCSRADQAGYKYYEIICAVCGDLIATVALKDGDINSWCNLHYVSEAKLGVEKEVAEEIVHKKGKKPERRPVEVKKIVGEWHGCMTPSISPMDEKLGFECACGNDTRDFRMSHLTNASTIAKMKENMNGREFNQEDSKYLLREIN